MSPVATQERKKRRSSNARSGIEGIRNIGVVAHIDSGKTTITERMLKISGRIRLVGEVHDGEATMDFTKEEQTRGITIGSAATNFQWDGHQIHLIDTPGHVDFTAEVERSCRVLDGAILAVDSVAGAQAQTETVKRQLDKYHVARLAFINKMDRVGSNFREAVASLRNRLGLEAVPIQIPVQEGPDFRGMVDLVRFVQIRVDPSSADPSMFEEMPVAEEMLEEAGVARQEMLEAISMYSDPLLEMLLEGREPPVDLILDALRHATCFRSVVPCLCGAALKNIGVPQLLTSAVDYLPSPVDKGAVQGHDPRSGHPRAFDPCADASPGCLVFKTVHFPTGDLTFVRVYSGRFSTGDALYNPRLGGTERVGRLFTMHADSREPIECATAGQIVACMGLKESATGDSLCSKRDPIAYGATTFANPVISMAIEPASGADRDRMSTALGVVAREDPTFRVFTDGETGETIISGMGELHLEVVTHRIRDEFRLRVKTGKPRVAYRQTFSSARTVESRHVKQTGGSGQYAVAIVEFEPVESDTVEFVDSITHGKITKEFLQAMEKGIRAYLARGGRRGAQIQGVRATVVDGKMHDVDSSVTAFHACGHLAARMAEERCGTILLEPIMRIEVTTPEDCLGAILGDLSSRRGSVGELKLEGRDKVVLARVPLAELCAYSTTLRSLTSGRGDYSMEPDGYEPVPASLVDKA